MNTLSLKDYCAMLLEENYEAYEHFLYKQEDGTLKVFDILSEEEYEIPLYSIVKHYLDQLEKEEEYDLEEIKKIF